MLHVVLWEPEIPPNTGNVARLCAATGVTLHLVGRLGFHINDRSLRRAGLDYWHAVDLRRHVDFTAFEAAFPNARPWCFSARAKRLYTDADYRPGDALVFGSETHGLSPEILDRYAERTRTIPMPTGNVRSLNLATAVGIVLYDALRQLHAW